MKSNMYIAIFSYIQACMALLKIMDNNVTKYHTVLRQVAHLLSTLYIMCVLMGI